MHCKNSSTPLDQISRELGVHREALHQLLQSNQIHSVDPMIIAWAYLGTGDKDHAFGWFEKAYLRHSNELVSIKASPACDPLRTDPRFQDLLRRIALAP
jgi:hypothetical protein